MVQSAQLEKWDFSCPDWWERLQAGRSLLPALPLDQAAAHKGVAIFNNLKIPNVIGKPAFATAAAEWQRDIVRATFGSIVDGRRMIPEIGVLVPKKNSKTTGGAGIMVTALLINERPLARLILVGPTQETANLAFSQAAGMIRADDYLSTRFKVRDHIKQILDLRNGATLEIKSFDLSITTGLIPSGILIDELHEISRASYASEVLRQLRGGMISQPESFMIFITTQSDREPSGAFKAELHYWRGIRDGRIKNGRALPMLYEFPEAWQTDLETKPWADPKNWHYVLPNLGRSFQLQDILDLRDAAIEKGDEEFRGFASQHLNVEIGLALHADAWIGARYWEGRAHPQLGTLEQFLDRVEVVTAGIDGGGLDDLFGLSLVGRDRETKDWLSWGRAWCHDDVFKRRKEIAEKLRDLVTADELIECKTATQDVEEVVAILKRVKALGLFPETQGIGYDPYAIAALVEALEAADLGGEQIVPVRQGTALSPATWGLERKLKDGTFWHSGQEIVTWSVGNAKCEQRGNAQLITKQAAGKAKIDPLVALFNATMLMAKHPIAAGVSVFEERGLTIL